jgi:hypothetical protein
MTARFALLVCGAIIAISQGHAEEGIDARTREALIEKLTRVHRSLAPNDSSRAAITLRLADLHAERARMRAFDELRSGCTKCVAGRDDRIKALELYQEALPQTPRTSIGKVLAQIGHLNEMNGNETEAMTAYERILKEVSTQGTGAVQRAEAHLSLGEIYFKRRNFSRARDDFKKVVETPSASSRGLAAYRLAWCDFNSSRLEDAINDLVKVLRTPELLTRNASIDVTQADPAFQAEVARDLAMFLSRRAITQSDVDLVFELSPDRERLANIAYFAGEAERLGQVKAAILAWKFAQSREKNPTARLTTHVHLAQLYMESRDLNAAGREFASALSLYPQAAPTCAANSGTECKELKSRLRKFVLDWNHGEKLAPSELLLTAYQDYLRVFSRESDMAIWGAKLASDRKRYELSVEMSLHAAAVAAGEIDKEASSRLENALLSSIEAAELAKSAELRLKVYEQYLAQSNTQKKTLDVRYQLAHMLYEKGSHEQAAQKLREVAFAKEPGGASGASMVVRKTAAELSLDALVLLKDDVRLEIWAKEYARVFPADATGFIKVARRAVLNQSVNIAKGAADLSLGEGLEKSWTTLSRFDASSATNEEKTTYYKNRLILAEKLRKLPEARDAAEQLLRLPEISGADREFALSRQAWLAELNLDFKTALLSSQKLRGLAGEARWLKLAMLAELAGVSPAEFYQEFLKVSKDQDKNQKIAFILVRSSIDPVKEIERQSVVLAKKPEVLASLYLDLYAKSPSADLVKRILASKELAATAPGRAVARLQMMDEVARLGARFEKQKINSKTQKSLSRTLKERVDHLSEAEKLATRAVAAGDWTAQILTLDFLGKQSDRFYQEILALPVPQGLNGEEEQQYLQLLSQQAAPHQTRAKDIAKKLGEFWANQDAFNALETSMKFETGARRKLVQREVEALRTVAPTNNKERLQTISDISEPKRVTPNFAALEKSRQMVRDEPFNREHLVKLLELERRSEKAAMVSYLEGRIEQMNGVSQ